MGEQVCSGRGDLLTRATDSRAFLEVLLRVVEKFEEIRGLSCGETGDGRVVLVGVVFASKVVGSGPLF